MIHLFEGGWLFFQKSEGFRDGIGRVSHLTEQRPILNQFWILFNWKAKKLWNSSKLSTPKLDGLVLINSQFCCYPILGVVSKLTVATPILVLNHHIQDESRTILWVYPPFCDEPSMFFTSHNLHVARCRFSFAWWACERHGLCAWRFQIFWVYGNHDSEPCWKVV